MLHDRGLEGLGDAVEIATAAALQAGLVDARVTSDAKHVEIGLTDKADGSRWLFCELWRIGSPRGLVLVVGDEFGLLGGLPGSDSHLLVPPPHARRSSRLDASRPAHRPGCWR